jgi:hypothetical protein
MITFKQYIITEAPATIDVEQSQAMLDDQPPSAAGKYDRVEEHPGPGNYTLHFRSWKSEGSRAKHTPHHILAIHDDTEEAHFSIRGGATKDKYIMAKSTKKHSDSEISGPEFYHSILHSGKVKGIQSDHEQSEGGKSIWHRLVHNDTYNDVEVTHHDGVTGRKIPLHTGDDWHKNFDTDRQTVFRARLKQQPSSRSKK